MTNITIAFGRQFVVWYVFNAYSLFWFFNACPYKLIVKCSQNKVCVTITC